MTERPSLYFVRLEINFSTEGHLYCIIFFKYALNDLIYFIDEIKAGFITYIKVFKLIHINKAKHNRISLMKSSKFCLELRICSYFC
jgi:hypothetical protein